MATTVSILENFRQHDGRQHVRGRFVHSSGDETTVGPVFISAATNAQSFFEAMIPEVEAEFVEREQELIIQGAGEGTLDPTTVLLKHHTRDQIVALLAKHLFNRMRNADTSEEKFNIIKNALPHLGKFTDAQIALLIGWTEQQVSTARSKLVAFKGAIDALDHRFGAL